MRWVGRVGQAAETRSRVARKGWGRRRTGATTVDGQSYAVKSEDAEGEN
jgi:hypothetical protein